MLKTIQSITVLAALSLVSLAGVAGCAADATGNENASSSSEDLSKKHHYQPAVSGVAYDAGCGPVHLPGAPCATPKIVLTYTKEYVDLQTSTSIRVDSGKQVITITVDTWSTNSIHSEMKTEPEALDIEAPKGLVPGATYTVSVKDHWGTCIFTGEIKVMLAA